eukprot:CAMPEP_0198727398 /NCGR_PEP_ID=MMETSP1475-20131203/4142_1 /TAXON_ID= ORGANISM="Unidentified sp., Strain CCMP1999" /NCGR_SAMPLE_ID=MMETSP1475 /ASSEMBLY_ACC=CAM_ASM_001111 /LENGTH=260 /DNA_ID=CAMNT_0044489433 /DNA_START=67 /DNA_END=850 /DNA_ORIENTATION=+
MSCEATRTGLPPVTLWTGGAKTAQSGRQAVKVRTSCGNPRPMQAQPPSAACSRGEEELGPLLAVVEPVPAIDVGVRVPLAGRGTEHCFTRVRDILAASLDGAHVLVCSQHAHVPLVPVHLEEPSSRQDAVPYRLLLERTRRPQLEQRQQVRNWNRLRLVTRGVLHGVPDAQRRRNEHGFQAELRDQAVKPGQILEVPLFPPIRQQNVGSLFHPVQDVPAISLSVNALAAYCFGPAVRVPHVGPQRTAAVKVHAPCRACRM